MSTVKKNIIYNVLFESLNLVLPLITTPYIARVIGVEGVGTYAYTYAIVQYFLIFIALGMKNYGNRTIARQRKNKDGIAKTFWELFAMQMICALLVCIFYVCFVLFSNSDYKKIFIIEGIFLLATAIDVNWFFYGTEQFKITIKRNLIIKLLTIILIFSFVKDEGDLILYVCFMCLSTLLSNLYLWAKIIKQVKFVKPDKKSLGIHFKRNLLLFVPVIAISIYNTMDKIMVGQILDTTSVGLYENSEKIINIPINLLAAISTVMLPRMSFLMSDNKEKQAKQYIGRTMDLIMLIAMPMAVGIIILAEEIISIYLGDDFLGAVVLVRLLAILIPIKMWANIIRTQYLLPNEKDKTYTLSVLAGAIVNFILNFFLIRTAGVKGAVIATIVAEISVCIIQTITASKNLQIKEYLKVGMKYMLKSVIMGVLVVAYIVNAKERGVNELCYTLVSCAIGMGVYCILNLTYIKANIINGFKG